MFIYISTSKMIPLDRTLLYDNRVIPLDRTSLYDNRVIPVDIDNFILDSINAIRDKYVLIRGKFSKVPKEVGNCRSLINISFYNTEIVDISSLSNLTSLQYLVLNDNKIVDISALSNLKYLLNLDLRHNIVVDISALSSLTRLQFLGISNNKIKKNMINFNSKIIIY